MRRKLPIVSASSIVVSVAIGTVVVRSGLRPVRLVTDAIQHVVETMDFQPVTVNRATGEVARLTSSFNRLLQMVVLMRERQARLVLDAGHELRNPLTSLRANVDLLAVDVGKQRLSAEQRTELVGDVQAQLGELTGLVTDLTHLARNEDEVTPQPIDVCEVVEAAVDRVRRRGQDRVFDVELHPLFMVGHADSLSRAVVNLLDNAVKWTPSGGTIRVRLDGNRLQVSDEGPGIPDADLPYLFDRYFRGETGRGTPGTGLGLSIVAKSVADHGGSVRAGRSASGGAEFTVQLPGVTSREALSSLTLRSPAQLAAAISMEADTAEAAARAERAVLAAAETARTAAAVAQRARAVATSKAARMMAETVRQQALAVQDQANAAAREVAAVAARAAARVHAAVLPGQELEAQREAMFVAQMTAEAAVAKAEETALAADEAARAAAAAASGVAAEVADAAMVVELEVRGAAKAMREMADAAAEGVAVRAAHTAELTRRKFDARRWRRPAP